MKKIWYKGPAKNWDEAFPVGNGRLGAKIFGNTGHEIIQFNEESVWTGGYIERTNKSASNSLKEIRSLIDHERIEDAQELVYEAFSAVPSLHRFYKSAGELHLDFYDAEHFALENVDGFRNNFKDVDSYRRELDFTTGIATTEFSVESVLNNSDFARNSNGGAVTYKREVFASLSSNTIIIHISSTAPKSVFFRAQILKDGCEKKYSLSDDTIVMLDTSGVPYAVMATAVSSGGTVRVRGESLIVENADEATIYLDVESAYSFGGYRRKCGVKRSYPLSLATKCADLALKRICFASGTSYENSRRNQVTDFASLLEHAELETDNENLEKKSVDEIKEDKKLSLEYDWNFERYKFNTGCSALSSLPMANIGKGLWKNEDAAVKTEGFDLLSKKCGMIPQGVFGAEKSAEALFKFLKTLYKHGSVCADEMYKCHGFVAHNSTDIWGDPCPCGTDLSSSYIPLGAAKLAPSVLEYYEYSLDKKFLKKNFYLLKNACDFFADYLVSADENKKLILSPSFTEKGISAQSENAESVIYELFDSTIKAMKYLNQNAASKDFVKYQFIKNRLSHHEENTASGNAFTDITSSIVSSRIVDGRVEIKLLNGLSEELNSGSLKNVCLKGKIFADISWKNGNLTEAKLFTKQEVKFIPGIIVVYKGKSYDSNISSGTLDLRNVLPNTI